MAEKKKSYRKTPKPKSSGPNMTKEEAVLNRDSIQGVLARAHQDMDELTTAVEDLSNRLYPVRRQQETTVGESESLRESDASDVRAQIDILRDRIRTTVHNVVEITEQLDI